MICYQCHKLIFADLLLWGLFRQKCLKMVICALFWVKKIEKMADFCGFAGVFVVGGAVFRGFFGGGVVDFAVLLG